MPGSTMPAFSRTIGIHYSGAEAFLDDFHRHWPTDRDHTYVDFIREGMYGDAAARSGSTRWRRSFDKPRTRGKALTLSLSKGIRTALGDRMHFWPFIGWTIPAGRSASMETWPPSRRPNAPWRSSKGWVLGARGICHSSNDTFAPPLAGELSREA
jgi:hypothetical protein